MADTGLRGKVADYKAYILSLLFFKRLSANYEWESQNGVNSFIEGYGKDPTEKQIQRIRHPIWRAAKMKRPNSPSCSPKVR